MAPRKPRKAQAIDLLAGKLSQWINAYGLQNDAYLTGLLDAVENKKDLHIWAELDPERYLPHPEAEAGKATERLVRLVTVIRNVLVFAPVALTWAAVGAATTGFSKYISANGADVVNFLDFWQNGYDILGNEWRIGNVARLDFIIVTIVIILTLYVSRAGHKADDLRDAAEAQIDRERMALAIEIHAAMLDKRKISNVTMNASLAGAISRLVTASRNLEDASHQIEKVSRKMPRESASPSFLDGLNFEEPKGKRSRRA